MELSWMAVVLVAALLLLMIYAIYSFAVAPFRLLSRCGIRGPATSPFYGNQKMVINMGRLKFTGEMLKIFGPVFGYYVGQQPIVVIATLDTLKEITVKQFDNFQDRPQAPDLYRKKSGTPRGLFNARGDYWKKIRVTLSPAFSGAKLKMMTPLIADRCKTVVEILGESADTGNSVEVFGIFGKLAMETILAAAFGRIINIQRGESDQFVDAAKQIFGNITEGRQLAYENLVLFLSNFPWAVPFLRYKYSQSKGADAYRSISKLALALIKARRESPDQHNYKDLLQLMIDATTEERGEQRRLSDEEILSQCFTFIAAGYETTANGLAYTAYLLALNPDIQDKLIEQITEYTSDHPDASLYEMVQELNYLDMVIQESLRLYPPAPETQRHCNKNVSVGGVIIPEGASVKIPIWHIHHDPQHWNEPDKFDPDRFSPEEKAKHHPLAHMPFGWGPRNCIGMRFVLLEMKLTLISILKRYRFVRAPETEDPLQVRIGITMSPKNGVFLRIASQDTQK